MAISAKLVILPQWVKRALEANKLSLAHALDPSSLVRILSINDVAFYVAVNQYLFDKIHRPLGATFQLYDLLSTSGYVMSDNHGHVSSRAEVATLYERLRNKVEEYYMEDFQDPKDINPRHLIDILAYNELSETDDQKGAIDSYLFDFILLKDDVYGVTFKEHDVTAALGPQLIKAYNDLLRFITGIHGLESVASTEVFSEFVSLSRRAAIW